MNFDPKTIEGNRYNLEILPQLEAYVQYQVEHQTYNLDANLTVMKFYQFHPEKMQKMIISKILIKALMNLPSSDFLLVSYVLPEEKLLSEEPIKTIFLLSTLLETANFGKFWQETKPCRELLDMITGFDDSIRGFIIGTITQTYTTISKDFLSEVLNMKGTDLDALITARGWKQTTDSVIFPKGEDVSTKSKKISENIKLEDLTRILSIVQ